jgi:catechol 2,3-dioxygenase-like lactoylglutathione lyase family enzyme
VAPGLTVDDLASSIKFFEGLGFVVTDRWEEDGKLLGVMLGAGMANIGLAQDDGKAGTNRTKGVGSRIWIEDQAERGSARRGRDEGRPHSREGALRDSLEESRLRDQDPEGFAITISTPMT